MTERPLTVAVTALNATDNPGPGVAVLRALNDAPEPVRVVGLAYDALDPGIYAPDIVPDVFLIPYPSQGVGALAGRLREIDARVGGLDVVIPTLDSELMAFIALAPLLDALGVGTFMPTRQQLELRSKAHLTRLGEQADIPVPASKVLGGPEDLLELHEEIPYPFFLKGVFYGARRAATLDDAITAYHQIVARWGLPVLAQAAVWGDEIDVCAVGDGRGGLVGAVAMKKTTLTDKGKGWAGVAIKDPEVLDLTARFARATRWRGPFEFEAIRDADGGYHLLEINPRFPAWCYLTAGAGQNLPWAVAQLAAGRAPDPLPDYQAGVMFVRIALDQIADISDLERISTSGDLVRSAVAPPPEDPP